MRMRRFLINTRQLMQTMDHPLFNFIGRVIAHIFGILSMILLVILTVLANHKNN